MLGLLQGFSELFPISSLGHSVILPGLFGWDIHQNDNFFLAFLVATHLATALVLLGFFWDDWVRIVRGLFRSLQLREIAADDTDAKLGWMLVVGTIPAGLHRPAARAPAAPPVRVADVGFVLPDGERFSALRSRAAAPSRPGPGQLEPDPDARIARTPHLARARSASATAQALALIPGISRSGATMGGGLLAGLSNEDAARFAFLLATPIIGAAAVLKLPCPIRPRRRWGSRAGARRRRSARRSPPTSRCAS